LSQLVFNWSIIVAFEGRR